MNKVERNIQEERLKRFIGLETKINILAETLRRVDKDNSAYTLTICGVELNRGSLGNDIIDPLCDDISKAIENQIWFLEHEQEKI